MSYSQYPRRCSTILKVGEQTQELMLDSSCHDAPPQIRDYLCASGWIETGQDPTTYEPLFTKSQEDAAWNMYYKWYEAVAYEFWKFLTLTNGND